VRESATRALGQLRDPQATLPLLAALTDAHSNVRGSAAQALGQLGDPQAIPPLLAALTDADSNVRGSAAQALGQLGDPQAIPPLLAALADPDNSVRLFASMTLAKLGSMAAVPLITALARRTYEYETEQIISALVQLAPKEAVLLLDIYIHNLHGSAWSLRLRGHALVRLGDNEAALVNFRQAVDQEESCENLLALAQLLLENGNPTEADTYTDQALKIAPKEAICLLSQAVIDWVRGDHTAAQKGLAEALRRDRQIANAKDLQFDHFWGPQALAALEQMTTTEA
jgi:HEAT repeat protein